MEALKKHRQRRIYDLTVEEVERLALERGLHQGLQQGLHEGRQQLLELARRLLPPSAVRDLEHIEDVAALRAEIERRLGESG